jgi:hypothetical protein
LHEPNASGTGPDPSAPRTNASTGEVVNATATVFSGSVTIDDQTFEDNTTTVNATASDLQPETASDYVVVVHNQTGVPAGGVGPPIGFSDNLTGAQTNATVSLTEEITQTTPLLAMLHFPGSPAGTPIPTLNGTDFGIGDAQAGTVTDTATAEIVTGQVAITDSPATVERGDNLSGQVAAEITADEVTTSTASIEATLVFEGIDGEPEQVLGTETVDLGVGGSETVTFTGLDPIRGNATAVDSVSANLRVETSNDADTNTTSLTNPIQKAIDFADANNIDTVDVEPGTYEQNFDIATPGLTLTSTGSAAETTIDIGPTDRVNIDADNVTVDGFSVVFEGQATYIPGGSDNVTISNNDFALAEGTESQGYAVRYEGLTSDGEVRDNTFTGINNTVPGEFGNGLLIAGPDGHEVVGNDFVSNSIGINVGGNQPAGELLVQDNTFTGQDNFSIALNHDASGTPAITVSRNNFSANAAGVLALAGGSITVTENNFNDSGVDASALSGGDSVDATENWWGNISGPSGAGPGVGSPVSENVTFDPWLDAPYPAGQPVTDGDIDIFNLDADAEGTAGESVNATATIENGLQSVTTNAGRDLLVEHLLLTGNEEITLAQKTVPVVPGETENVSFSSTIPENVSDLDADHRIQVRDQFASQNLAVFNGNVTFNDQVLGTNASGDPAVLVEDVETNADTAVVVTYPSGGDLVIAGLTEVANTSGALADVTVAIEDMGGFPGEHTAHVIRADQLSQNYTAGDTVSAATAEGILDSETATVFDGSVTIDDQTFEDNTTTLDVNTSDLQPAGASDYVVVVHNQTGVASGGVGPAIEFSANQSGLQNNVTVSLTEEINQTTPLLAMLHFPSASGPAGAPIPVLNDTAFGIGDAQAGTVTDTATATIVEGQVTITQSPSSASRGDNLSGAVTADITASEVTGQNTAAITAELIFDGVPGESPTTLGTETVRLGAGESQTVTFDTLDPIPNATTASDGEPVTLRVDANRDSDSNTTDLSHSVQNAVDFAVFDGQSAVDLLAGTYPEEVTIDTDNATIAGAGTSVTTIDGNVTVTGDNNTLENFTIDGNLTLDGANNDASNVTVTGSTTSPQSVGTYQSPGGGNVFVNNDATLTDVDADTVQVNSGTATISSSTTGTLELSQTANVDISDTAVETVEGDGRVVLEDASGLTQGVFDEVGNGIDNASAGGNVELLPGTFDESVTVDVTDLTVEGPNAGTPGDNNTRGSEATITQGVEINASGVTLDGLDVTNSDVNGIVITEAPSDVTVANTVVRDIAGGTAGASKGVGNGVNLQFNDVANQTSTGIEVTNNLITGVTTPDASGTDPDADAIGVQLLPRGNDVVDLRVANNTIENIQPGAASGGRSEARAVSIATQFTNADGQRGDFGQATNLTVADNDVSNLTADFARAVNLFEDKGGDTTTNDALGPVNFTVTGNTVTEINSTDGSLPDLAMFVGEYGNFGADHSVQRNNFLAGVENFGGSSDALNATENWWGNESGPAFDGPGVGPGFVLETGGSVVNFDPWLNAPVPGGQPVTDGDFAVQSFQSDNTSVQRGDTVSASADVTNDLQPVSSNRDAGQVPLEYVLIDSSGGVEVINSTTVEITPGTTDTVTLSGTLSTASTVALDNETLTHRIRIASETSTAADGSIDVSHSIDAAISAAGTGDTVTVRAGTYEESVTADVAGLTLEPAASATPTVVGQSSNAVTVGADDVTVSGLDIQNPTGSGDGNTSVNAVGVKVDPANTNVTIENNSIGPVGTAVNTNVIGVYVERDADDVTVTNNTLSMLDGTVDDEDRTQAILLIAQEGGNVGSITGATIFNNTVTNVTDTRSVKAIEFNGNISGSIAENDISDLDTDGPAGTGFTQAIALGQGSNANTGPSDVLIENNTISNLEPGTPADFAAPSHIILSAADDVSTIDITDNEFSALADDELFVLDRATGNFDLQGALDANTFTPSAVQVTDGSDRALVPETGVRVVNVDQRTGFDQIQPAVDAANAGDTIDIKSGTYSEEVTVTDSDVAAPAAGSAESTHSWNFTGIDYGQSGNNGDQVDTITVDYPAGTSFDGLNQTDITVVMTRTLSGGKDTSEISVNDDQYSGSTATFDLSGFSQTDVAGPIELTIEGIQNPSVGSYDVDVTLDGDAGQKTFTESLSIGSVTLDGSGSSSSGTVLQAPSSGSGNGITANASSLTVRDLRVTDYANGIRLRGTNSGLTFENVASVGNNVRGVEVRNSANLGNLVLDDVNLSNNSGNGIRVATEGIIDGLTIVNSSLNNNRDPNADQFGAAEAIAVFQSEGNPAQLNDVVIRDTEFVDNGGKAIYTEKLSNAVFDNISIDGVLSDVYGFNSGIDINLKYDNYSNITIRDSTVANVSEGNPFNNDPSFSTAIAVKARDDPSSYDTNPATLDDVTIDGVTIEDSFNGLRIGEPGVDYSSAPEGPSNVTITSSTFRNTTGYYVEDVPGDLDLSAVLNGQGNTFDPTAVIVPNENKIVPEENVNILNIDENTGFRSIQAAVDAANAGDTIEVKANTYSESVDITTSGLTLRGVADANGNSPVIEGNGVNTGSQPHAAVHVDDGSGPVRNVTIEGFRITNPSGNFGIFAGTGSTNSNNDGIGGLVVQNNVVDNISSQTTGGSLTGGPAGIGIRGDYGTDGNPGIEISNNQISNVQSEGFTNAVGITLKSFTGDAGFGKNSTGADVDDPSSPPATDTDILNNDISNIDGGNDSRTKGISVSGEFEDVLVEGNSISGVIANASGTSGNAFGVTFTENGGSYSGNQYDIDNDGNGERIGPRNFTISGNDIAQITADSPVNIFIGGYEDLNGTDDHVVEGNNLNDTGAAVSRFAGDQPGYQIGDGDTLDVRNNFWGNSTGPSGEDGVGGSGAPAITVGTDSSGNDRSGKVAADESASDPAGYSMTPN